VIHSLEFLGYEAPFLRLRVCAAKARISACWAKISVARSAAVRI
jgi:hypothetical protein